MSVVVVVTGSRIVMLGVPMIVMGCGVAAVGVTMPMIAGRIVPVSVRTGLRMIAMRAVLGAVGGGMAAVGFVALGVMHCGGWVSGHLLVHLRLLVGDQVTVISIAW